MTTNDSPLIQHAEREMRLAGLYDEDADYDGMVPEAVMSIVRVFAEQGHSGYSAALVTSIVEKVLRFEPLTPITSNPDEWMEIAEDVAGRPDLWQSRRNPALFSHDGGQTWYDVDDLHHE